jgi:recombination protein RecA
MRASAPDLLNLASGIPGVWVRQAEPASSAEVLHFDRAPAAAMVERTWLSSQVQPVVGGGPSLDQVLPDGGLPRGAVVEVSAFRGLGRITSLGLAACASAQAEARSRGGDERTLGAMCAFVDPWGTLHGPALLSHRVDPTRLIVVRPPLEALSRVVVRMAESHAFAVIVVDTAGVPGAAQKGQWQTVSLDRWGTVVRRLALAVERADTTILLLTDSAQRRALPLPVSLRLEVESPAPKRWLVKVAKDRFGRVAPAIQAALAG